MNYQFELSEAEANVILEALGEVPLKKSLGIVNKMQAQYREQLQKAEVAKELKIQEPEE
jgi:hypothetical protein